MRNPPNRSHRNNFLPLSILFSSDAFGELSDEAADTYAGNLKRHLAKARLEVHYGDSAAWEQSVVT